MIQFPRKDSPILKQTNKGNLFGDLWASFNLNLTKTLGRIRTGRMLLNNSSAFNTDLGCPVAFKYFNSLWWTVAGLKLHSTSATQTGFTVNTTDAGSFNDTCNSDVSDLELFNGFLFITTATDIYSFSGTVFSQKSAGGLTTNTAHMMCVYADRLYITNLFSKIYSMDTAYTLATSGSYTLSFTDSNANVLTFLRPASNKIWVGVLNTLGGKGYVYEWDGTSTQVTRSYRLESQGALAGVIKDDIPYIVDSNGRLLAYNGSSFKEVARFPVDTLLLKSATNATVNTRFIHPNGMAIVDGRINILINNLNGDNGATINENFPSGVWEYDENIGLYHKYSVTYVPKDGATADITDYGQNRVSRVGALADAKITNSGATANGQLLVGLNYYTNASSTLSGVFIDDTNDTVQKYGYFVTQWIAAASLRDTWQKLFLQYRKFLDSADKIICKYRTTEVASVEATITWVNTTSFTTTTNVLGKEGQEVEVIQGTGSGKTAHITTIANNAGTYTVTLDDTFTGVTTGTAKARFQAWIKLGEITGQTTESWQMPIGVTSERIQLKVCMQFTGADELHTVSLINKPHELLV